VTPEASTTTTTTTTMDLTPTAVPK
jgi:hypothetical protein